MSNYYYDRIDELGAVAEEALEGIPTDASEDRMLDEYADLYDRYEDCVNMIHALQQEMGTGYPERS